MERALYRASLELASLRKGIVNKFLLGLLRRIIEKLLVNLPSKVLTFGRSRAEELKKYLKKGRFSLCPNFRGLFEDMHHLFWLGNEEALLKGLRML
ncbi:MAG: hypothetical protein FGF53_01620 [Candidatus Brockarchaeota archaeon]|nr:hypothetical protein [Candidatus Brockarchaeota archaeon]MBO3808681.1 hypothetical protein [Candidatus Brockarchaeota archaeon]